MLSLYDIKEILGTGDLNEVQNRVINEWVIDSRRISHPTQAIFVALAGEVRDGHDFIEDAYQKGIRVFLISESVDIGDDAVTFVVDDTLKAMQYLAQARRARFEGHVIGITGSNGKTILKEWLTFSLSEKYTVYKSPKSYNSQIGVALSLLEMDDKADYVIIEAGISQEGEMQKLYNMIKPDIGVFTYIGDMHQEGFENIQSKIREKCLLFQTARAVHVGRFHNEKWTALCTDMLQELGVQEVHIVSENAEVTDLGSYVHLNTEIGAFDLPYYDQGSIDLSLLLFQILQVAPTRIEHSKERMRALPPVSMRLEFIDGISGCKIINDAYSLDMQSLKIAMAVLDNQSEEWHKTVILSDIKVDQNSEGFIEELKILLERYQFQNNILIGQIWKKIDFSYLNGKIHLYNSTTDLMMDLDALNFSNEYILIKGARRYQLEKVVEVLRLKKHSVSLEVNLNNLRSNILHYKGLLHANTKMMMMVKSQSYGGGEYEIAKNLQNWGIDYLGVAYTDEGVTLRQKGITVPIMVMNPEVEGIEEALDHGLEIEVYNDRILDAVNKIADKKNLKYVPIHIKLDTGMHRLGWSMEELDALIHRLRIYKSLRLVSTFTHLYAADEKEGEGDVHAQIQCFDRMIEKIRSGGIDTGIRHVLNTAGIEHYSQYQMDMVRLGIGAYGVSPFRDQSILPVYELYAEIAQISEVKAHQQIGYGIESRVNHDRLIATINIGYADGYMRSLGNGNAQVFIRGRRFSTVGNICMDMFFVDITGNDDIAEGDHVEILGRNVSIQEVAQWAGTISYEIMTGISSRIPRVYRWE